MGRTVTASIGPHYEEFIRESILSGRYNNASEVIREGLRRLEEDEARLEALRAALDEGEASPDVEDFDPEAFLLEMKAKRSAND
jgi:antitoxin ParD1/3/4